MATPMYRFAGGTASQSDQTRVVLIGDSFASRFHRYCRAPGFVNGGLDPLRFSLSVVSRGGGALLGLVNDAAPRISEAHATKAILTLGGNDLDRPSCEPLQLAKDLLNIARHFVRVDGFSKVAICQLCYCYPPSGSRAHTVAALKHPLRPGYNVLVDAVNAELRRLISFFPAIHFWKHRGMLLDYQSLVCDDGVHVNATGERLYFRSIRGAALFLSKS